MNSKTITYCVAAVVIVAVVACLAIALAQGSDDTGDDGPTVPSTPEPEEPAAPVVQSPRWHTVIFDAYGDSSKYDYVYVDVGDRLSEPADPENDCMIFTGWAVKDTSQSWNFSNTVRSDMILVGQWTEHFTVDRNYLEVTLTLNDDWVGGSTLIDWGDGTTSSLSPGEATAIHVYEAAGYKDVQVVTIVGSQTVSSGSEVPVLSGGHFPQRIQRTVTFQTGYGATTVPSQTVNIMERIYSPQAPSREGYLFDGWYRGSTEWNFDDPVEIDMQLTARWVKDPYYDYSVVPEAEVDVGALSDGWLLDASGSTDSIHYEWYVNGLIASVDDSITISYQQLTQDWIIRVSLYVYSDTMDRDVWTYTFYYQ